MDFFKFEQGFGRENFKLWYGHFPDWTFPRPTLPLLTHLRLDNSPTNTSPAWHFSDQTFARVVISPTGHFSGWTFPRPDISPSGHLLDCTFPRLHISPFYTYYFRADISLTLNNLFLTGYFWQFKCRKRLNFLVNEW